VHGVSEGYRRVDAMSESVANFMLPSFPRKRESIVTRGANATWIPAFAGMTAIYTFK
jgi:hypothetical protein